MKRADAFLNRSILPDQHHGTADSLAQFGNPAAFVTDSRFRASQHTDGAAPIFGICDGATCGSTGHDSAALLDALGITRLPHAVQRTDFPFAADLALFDQPEVLRVLVNVFLAQEDPTITIDDPPGLQRANSWIAIEGVPGAGPALICQRPDTLIPVLADAARSCAQTLSADADPGLRHATSTPDTAPHSPA